MQEKFIETSPNPVTIDGTENILYQMKNCICRIISNNGIKGTGFFCRIPYNDKLLPVLITNYHVLNDNIYKKNAKIELTLNDGKKAIILNLDNSRIKFTNQDLDVTIIEIKSNLDKINHFLDIDENINTDLEYLYNNKSIYLLHYPKGTLANVSYGLSNKIINNNFNHFCNTEEGSSGAPILLLDSFKVIGIHKGVPKNQNFNFNVGTFIKSAIQLFTIEIDITNHNYKKTNEDYYQNNNNQQMNKMMNNMNYINTSKSLIYNKNSNNLIGNEMINIENPIFQEDIKTTFFKINQANQGTENLNYFEPTEGKSLIEESTNKGFIMDNNAFLHTSNEKKVFNRGTIVRPPIIKNKNLATIDGGIKVLPMVYAGTKVLWDKK